MKVYQSGLKADIQAGNIWTYSNHGVSGTFQLAEKNKNFKANCATIANWALRDLKVFKKGNYFWGRMGGELVCNEATLKVLQKHCKIIHINGRKTVNQVMSDGTLLDGDIVTYVNLQHTNVYAGNGRWYDAGHAYCKEGGEGAKFRTWYGKTVYGDQKVSYIIRYNGNTQKKTVYRVQIAAMNTESAVDKIKVECKKKTRPLTEDGKGLDAFSEKMSDGKWHVFCGSFEQNAKAEERLKLLKKYYPDAFIKQVIVTQ